MLNFKKINNSYNNVFVVEDIIVKFINKEKNYFINFENYILFNMFLKREKDNSLNFLLKPINIKNNSKNLLLEYKNIKNGYSLNNLKWMTINILKLFVKNINTFSKIKVKNITKLNPIEKINSWEYLFNNNIFCFKDYKDDVKKIYKHLKHFFKHYEIENYVLSHFDLYLKNIIFEKESNKLYFIDYEYVCLADKYLDYASFIGGTINILYKKKCFKNYWTKKLFKLLNLSKFETYIVKNWLLFQLFFFIDVEWKKFMFTKNNKNKNIILSLIKHLIETAKEFKYYFY